MAIFYTYDLKKLNIDVKNDLKKSASSKNNEAVMRNLL